LDVAFLKLVPQSGSFRSMEIQSGTTMLAQGRDGLGRTAYERHQPEQTLLYQLVEAHYPALVDQLARQGKFLPDHVHRAISTHLIHKAGLKLRSGATGAVTLIQRFGSALNLNIHFHILFLDGVYVHRGDRPTQFQRVKAPDKGELEELVHLISQRVGRCLERQGQRILATRRGEL
jgi:hypothetical protein